MVDNPIVVGTVNVSKTEKNRAIKYFYIKTGELSSKNPSNKNPSAFLLRG